MKLSVVIPVYNEEKTVAEVISRVHNVRLPIRKEIVVVDDASNDSSKAEIKKARQKLKINSFKLIEHETNQGKGAAVRSGISAATGNIVLIQDADLEYDPKDYPKLIKPILDGRSDVVFGTRLKNYPLQLFGKKRTPLVLHYLGNKFLTLFTQLLYGGGVTDMETCYKVFRREVLDGIVLRSKRFEFEPEITAKMLKKGYKIYEVPIRVEPRGYDEGKKITWKDGFIALWTLIKYRFAD